MFIAIGIFFVFLLLGMPVAFSIGLSGFSFFMIRDLPMTVLVQKSISTSQSFMSDVSTVIGFTSDFFFINPLSGF